MEAPPRSPLRVSLGGDRKFSGEMVKNDENDEKLRTNSYKSLEAWGYETFIASLPGVRNICRVSARREGYETFWNSLRKFLLTGYAALKMDNPL